MRISPTFSAGRPLRAGSILIIISPKRIILGVREKLNPLPIDEPVFWSYWTFERFTIISARSTEGSLGGGGVFGI